MNCKLIPLPLAVYMKSTRLLSSNRILLPCRQFAFYRSKICVPNLTLLNPVFCKHFSNLSEQSKENCNSQHDLTHIEASDDKTMDVVSKSVLIYPDFISAEEEKFILDEIEPYMKRLRYEVDHWDDVSVYDLQSFYIVIITT